MRQKQINKLAALVRAEQDAILCDEGPSGARGLRQAQSLLDAARRNSTDEEWRAAHRQAIQ